MDDFKRQKETRQRRNPNYDGNIRYNPGAGKVVNPKINCGGEGMSDSKNTASLTPYDENGFKEAEVIVKKDGSLEIRPKER